VIMIDVDYFKRYGHLEGDTCSMGVAVMTGNNDVAPQALVAEADKQLYQVKQAG